MKNLETKFNPKEKVWTVKNYKAVEMIVEEANLKISRDSTYVTYYLTPLEGTRDYESTNEEHIYLTREELIKNL